MNAPDPINPVLNARELVPFLSEHAAETEERRSMLPEVCARLHQAGLFRILTPPSLGGYGMRLRDHLEVAAELARGCGSTAWVQSLIGYQNYLIGLYPPALQQLVAAKGTALFTGQVMGPPVTAEIVEGGVRLTGRWPYVTGAHHANWYLFAARDPNEKGRVLTCLIPADEGVIQDDWFVMGLRGTGSVSVDLNDCFVPDDHVLCFREAERNGVPGAEINHGPLYQGVPTSIIFSTVVSAPALGMADAAISAFEERLRSRTNARMPSSQTEWPSSQARLGRAKARLRQARELLFAAADRLENAAAAGETLTLEFKSMIRMDAVESVRISTDIVYDLFCDAGTGAAMDGSVLQRVFRDIHTLRSHFMIMPDTAAENTGRILLGLDPRPPFQGG